MCVIREWVEQQCSSNLFVRCNRCERNPDINLFVEWNWFEANTLKEAKNATLKLLSFHSLSHFPSRFFYCFQCKANVLFLLCIHHVSTSPMWIYWQRTSIKQQQNPPHTQTQKSASSLKSNQRKCAVSEKRKTKSICFNVCYSSKMNFILMHVLGAQMRWIDGMPSHQIDSHFKHDGWTYALPPSAVVWFVSLCLLKSNIEPHYSSNGEGWRVRRIKWLLGKMWHNNQMSEYNHT